MNEDRRNLMVRNVQRVFTFIAILMLMIGQILVYTTPVQKDVIFPWALWISIAGILLFILSHLYRPSRFVQNFFARFQFSQTTFWITSAFILSLLAVLTMILFDQRERTNFIPVLTFWLFAAICYIAAFSKSPSSAAQVWSSLRRHRYELAGIGLVTLLGLALRFYKLGEIPKVVNGDEARVGIAALGYLSQNPFSLWENFGGLYTQVISLALKVFGVSPFSLRFAAAVGGTLAIPSIYLLARQISGRRIALIAACMLAVSHTHIHFSRTVAVAYIQGTWLIPLELYFLLSGLIKRSSWRTAASGVLLAMHYTVYLDSQIITALVLVYMLIAFLLLRPWFKPALDQTLIFWGGFGLILLPELVYILQHPDIFFDRLNQDGMFQTGKLAQTMASTGQNAAQVLGGRVVHAFLSLIYYPSIDFYGSLTPMLSLMSAMLFLLGLVVALWKMRSPGLLLLNGYFWAGTLSVGIFALPATADTYRMLIVLPAAFLLAAMGLNYVLQVLGLGWAQNWKVYISVTGLTLSGLLVFNTWAYYFNFAGRCLYSDDDRGETRFASYLGNYTHTVGRENILYLLSDDVYFYGSHDSVDFLSGRRPMEAMVNVPESIDTLQVKPNETLIATPNRIAELRTWANTHPGGELHYEYDCQDPILLAYQFP